MQLEWDDKYMTGNEAVDLQHHFFLGLINRIAVNLLETQDVSYQRKLLEELTKYADFHFTSEENVAFALGLPGLSGHRARHVEILEELHHHIAELIRGSYTTKAFIQFLMDWFTGHTVYEDSKLFSSGI